MSRVTKLTFWDSHSADFPVDTSMKDDRYLMAVYVLSDTAHEGMDICDYGIFSVGYGPGTLNVEAKRFGISWDRYSKKGNEARRVKGGVTQYRKVKMMQYPDTLKWVVHQEADGTVRLYKPQLLQTEGRCRMYSRGLKGYDVTGWEWKKILDNCNKDGFTYAEVNKMHERNEARMVWQTMSSDNWSVRYDGKSVIEVLANNRKVTYAELVNIITNEGGCIDKMGVIRKGEAANKIYNPYEG